MLFSNYWIIAVLDQSQEEDTQVKTWNDVPCFSPCLHALLRGTSWFSFTLHYLTRASLWRFSAKPGIRLNSLPCFRGIFTAWQAVFVSRQSINPFVWILLYLVVLRFFYMGRINIKLNISAFFQTFNTRQCFWGVKSVTFQFQDIYFGFWFI